MTKPSFLKSLRFWKPSPFQAGVAALAHLFLQLDKEIPRGTQVGHTQICLPALCNSSPSSFYWVRSIVPEKMVTPSLAYWFLGTRKPKCPGSSLGTFVVSPGQSWRFSRGRPLTLQSPELQRPKLKFPLGVTESDSEWSHSCFDSLVPRPMHSS